VESFCVLFHITSTVIEILKAHGTLTKVPLTISVHSSGFINVLHRVPIQWLLGGFSSEVKRPGRQADHSPPSSAEAKKKWSYSSALSIHLHGVARS